MVPPSILEIGSCPIGFQVLQPRSPLLPPVAAAVQDPARHPWLLEEDRGSDRKGVRSIPWTSHTEWDRYGNVGPRT